MRHARKPRAMQRKHSVAVTHGPGCYCLRASLSQSLHPMMPQVFGSDLERRKLLDGMYFSLSTLG